MFELLPATFTLLRLQRAVEALAGVPLHKQNFRRLVETGGLVEGTGLMETARQGPARPSSSASAARCCASAARRAWALPRARLTQALDVYAQS